jgi:NAD(P)-dependent dehydrogenase (short-subunit alcohol dehydrogenase family)
MKKKTTVIIGGTRGIGKTIYKVLQKRGDFVYRISRNLTEDNFNIKIDITEESSCDFLYKKFSKIKIDNLVFAQRYRGESNEDEFRVMIEATNKIINKFKKILKINSSIIILSSIATSTVIHDQDVTYHYIRGALESMVKYYACVLGPRKIRINSIQPTKILKPENLNYFSKKGKSDKKLIEKITPLKRMGSSYDVAYLVDFLTSDKSTYITGTTIPVDGGLRLVSQESIANIFVR